MLASLLGERLGLRPRGAKGVVERLGICTTAIVNSLFIEWLQDTVFNRYFPAPRASLARPSRPVGHTLTFSIPVSFAYIEPVQHLSLQAAFMAPFAQETRLSIDTSFRR